MMSEERCIESRPRLQITAGVGRNSQRPNSMAAIAPRISAAMNPSASAGRMPVKVDVNVRASVTAGLANDVEAVNQ
jgi:hypothetical protein